MKTNCGGKRQFHSVCNLQNRGLDEPEGSTFAGLGKAEARAWLTKLLTPRNCYALSSVILWRLPEKIYPSSYDSIQIVTRGIQMLAKKALQSGKSTDDHHNTAIYVLQWSNQLLKLKKQKQFGICDDYHRAEGLTAHCSRISFFVLSCVFSALPNRWT